LTNHHLPSDSQPHAGPSTKNTAPCPGRPPAYSRLRGKLASLAYAAGFLTILIQTAPLGIPVLDLFQAMTILAGIPIVLTLVLLAWLSRLLVSQYRSAKVENINTITATIESMNSVGASVSLERVVTLTTSLVLPRLFPVIPITGDLMDILVPRISAAISKFILNALHGPEMSVKFWLARIELP